MPPNDDFPAMDTTLTAAKTVELQHPAGYTADIALQGATVVSWKVNGQEKLFTSSKCVIVSCVFGAERCL